jgi:signal transduction histidine kinase
MHWLDKQADAGKYDARLRFALEHTGASWWSWDVSLGRVCPGRAWCELAGVKYREHFTVGECLTRVHPSDRPGLLRAMSRYIRGERDRFECEYRVGPSAGIWRWVRSAGRLNIDLAHQSRVEGVHVDVEAVRRLGSLLERRTAEVEHLLSVIAHDLRGPLVTMFGFLDHVEEGIGAFAGVPADANASAELHEAFTMMRCAAEQMRERVSGLVQLGRVGRSGEAETTVELAAELDEVLGMRAGQIAARGLTVRKDLRATRVRAARQDVRQLLDVLISSPLRDAGDASAPELLITTRTLEHGQVSISVDDNGPSPFEVKDAAPEDRLRRLAARDANVRVGLTILHRIAEVYGGNVWADRSPMGGVSLGVVIGAHTADRPEHRLLGEEAAAVRTPTSVRPASPSKLEIRRRPR